MSYKRPEDVFITLLRSAYRNARHGTAQLIPPGTCISRRASRPLSSLAARGATLNSSTLNSSTGQRGIRDRTEKLPRARTRSFATAKASNGKPREIAVLGGGITGLTTAHYLARYAWDANITLYEGSPKLGGWVEGKMMRFGDGENDRVLFQHGPRMLRTGAKSIKYDDMVFYDVVASLKLESKLRSWDNHSNRYIYYPDHLVKMPGPELSLDNIVTSVKSFFTEPLWEGAFRSGLNMLRPRPDIEESREVLARDLARDVSVGEFMEKELHTDPRLVQNLASAMMHGIYGGDVYKLSAKCTMLEPVVWDRRLPRSIGCQWIEQKETHLIYDLITTRNRRKIIELAELHIHKSIMMFDDGLISLVDALVKDLEARPNVTIKRNSKVTSLALKGEQVSVSTGKTTKHYDKVIATLFSGHLAKLVEPQGLLPSLAETQAVTIMVVNLWFPNPTLLARNPGFGYLVPTTTPANDECVLGVLFDSDLAPRRAGEPDGTKLTVMLGGHHWDGWTAYPTDAMAKEMAVQAVRRHLDIPADEPVVADATLCRDCLPQHHVGHRDRMAKAHSELLDAFGGHLSVAGPSYTTVGVIPAMRAAFDAAMRVVTGRGPRWICKHPNAREAAAGEAPPPDHVGATGLEGFYRDELRGLQRVPRGQLQFRAFTDPEFRLMSKDGNWIRMGD